MSKPPLLFTFAGLAAAVLIAIAASPSKPAPASLWQVYEQSLKGAKYVDLTHTINPAIPV
jgi:kynurenine formamidase